MKLLERFYPQVPEREADQDCFINNLKFFLILTVVFGHFLTKIEWIEEFKGIFNFIYIFHMPCFVFVSGYLAKNMNGREKKRLKVDRILSLFWLYFVFKFGIALLDYLLYKETFQLKLFRDVEAPWYLFSLALWYLIIPFLEQIKPIAMIIMAFSAGLLIGFISGAGSSFSISRTVVFLPFFAIGFYLSEERLYQVLKKRVLIVPAFLSFVAVLYFMVNYQSLLRPVINIIYGGKSYAETFDGRDKFGFMVRFFWYVAAIFMSVCFMLIIPRCKLFFSKYGTRTLQVYILHIWVRKIVTYFGLFKLLKQCPDYISWTIFPGLILLTLFLSNRYFKKIFDFISATKLMKRLEKQSE